MNTFRRAFALFALSAVLAFSAFSAVPVAIETARAHTAAGSFGCTVSGETVATPSVLTCTAAHGLVDGDQVQVTGIVGTTTDNVTGYAKVTSYSTTTFALYSDAALSAGVTGTGAYSSGGKVSIAKDISALSGAFAVRLQVTGLTAAKNAVLCVQDSADGFVSDIVTLACANVSGPISAGSGVPVSYTWTSYQLPSLRAGVTNGRLRLNVSSIDGSATVTTSLFFEQ